MAEPEENTAERFSLIILGAISGIISLGVLTGSIQGQNWLSPVFGLLAVLLFMAGGLLGEQEDENPM